MSLPTININSNVVAFYAAIMSTIIALVQLSNYLRDKAKLKVTVELRRVGVGTDGKQFSVTPGMSVAGPSKLFVVINAVNLGRRPLKLAKWGGKYTAAHAGKKSFVIIPYGLPKILTEGDSLDEVSDDLHNLAIEDVKSISMFDVSGKGWKAPRSDIRQLKEDYQKFVKKQ